MKLQLAIDLISLQRAVAAARELEPFIDIVEVGTPLILSEGVRAVAAIKSEFPDIQVLADLKIMDAGELESRIALDGGADIVTVLGVADDRTIRVAADEAHRRDKRVMVDMIGVREIEARAREVDAIGVDCICVHTAFDRQRTGGVPLDELRRVERLPLRSRIAVAGGIRLETITEILREAPDVVIVGDGIMGQRDRQGAARELARLIQAQRRAEK